MKTKPVVQLLGQDGNVFGIIASVARALKKAGQPEMAKEFTGKAFRCGTYGEVLALVMEYVEVE